MTKEKFFLLTITIPDQPSREIFVADEILAGLDPRNDLILVDPLVRAKHFHFFTETGNGGIKYLSLRYLGVDGITKLNGVYLQNNKVYLLENNDRIKVGRIEISTSSKTMTAPALRQVSANKVNFKSIAINSTHRPLAPKMEYLKVPAELPVLKKPKLQGELRLKSFSDGLKLIPFKFYAFLVNVVLTFFILAFLIPHFDFLEKAFELLLPISNFLVENLFTKYPALYRGHTLSLIEFFICYHFFMIASSLVFAITPGEFLIGLRPISLNSNFLLRRIKGYFYNLINVFTLPLILFDIPCYRGQTIKEIVTFTHKEISMSFRSKISRKIIIPMFSVAALLSPLVLKAPFNTLVFKEVDYSPSFINANTTNLSTYSHYFGITIDTEISNSIKILPAFEKNKLGITLYDLKNNKQLIISEMGRRPHSQSLFKLRYANPLASFHLSDTLLDQEILKNALIDSFNLKHDQSLLSNLLDLIFKAEHLNHLSPTDSIFVNPFEMKNPFVKMTSGSHLNEQVLFFYNPRETIEFKIYLKGESEQTSLLPEIFTKSFLSPARYYQGTSNKLKDPQILEVLEAFELGNYQTLLTYYINEAKKSQADKLTASSVLWRNFLINNINQTKNALSGDKNKNIEKSFDDIIKTL